MSAFTTILASPFLPRGKGALILILGGFAMLLLAVITASTGRRQSFRQAHGSDPGRGRPPGFGHMLLGGMTGASCAFITYWVGGAFIAIPDLMAMPRSDVPSQFLRPFHTFTAWELAFVTGGATLGGLVGRYQWRAVGLLSYVALFAVIIGYVVYSITTALPQVPAEQRWLSYILLSAETAGLLMILIFSFYSLDVAVRRRWHRAAPARPFDPNYRPAAAVIIPVFNEPPEMVKKTIRLLTEQDYERHKLYVVVADDSTDAEVRAELSAYCQQVGATHVHRTDRRGFKAGAINHVVRLLPEEVKLVAVVDADYWVEPDYLKSVVGYFVDENMGFVQTPQDYRNRDESFLTRQYQRAEAYFYHGIMLSRNEEDDIIFCGTMGILSRAALEDIGGFAEDQICEDAEISIRLKARSWSSLYLDRSFGKGLMPAVFETYKKQFHRWAFGNVRILTSRFWLILRSPMKRRQKLDFVASNLHWFDGLFVMIIAATLLYLGLGPIIGYDAVTHHQREILLIGLVPVFLLVDGILRVHMVLQRSGPSRIRDTLLVQGMWFAIKFTNMLAAVKALAGRNAPFVRTPKDPGSRLGRVRAAFRSVRIAPLETLVGVTLAAVAAVHLIPGLYPLRADPAPLLAAWLLMYALFFLTAPIYAYLSYRTLAPAGGPPATRQPVRRRMKARAAARQS